MATKQTTKQTRTDRPSAAQVQADKAKAAETIAAQGAAAWVEYASAQSALASAQEIYRQRLLILARVGYAAKVAGLAKSGPTFAEWLNSAAPDAPTPATKERVRDAWSVVVGLSKAKVSVSALDAKPSKVETAEVSRVADKRQETNAKGNAGRKTGGTKAKGFAEFAADLDKIAKAAGDLPRSAKNRQEYVDAVTRLYKQVTA